MNKILVLVTLACSTAGYSQTAPDGPFQVKYASNILNGDAVINITNTGASATTTVAQPPNQSQFNINGSICVNIYAFAATEQEVACCSCLVTPNGLYSLSARNSLLNSVLTPAIPNELIIKLIATVPTTYTSTSSGLVTQTCNPGTIGTTSTSVNTGQGSGTLATGLLAWGTTVHAAPTTPVTYRVSELPFVPGTLSVAELQRDVTECLFIQILGSGNFGICKGCQNSGLGADGQ